ncbi:MAG: hypothetical protein WC208_14775 [Gallionella sp.]|jgi:alpha-tubulin suppressor-like RCC1 family protein
MEELHSFLPTPQPLACGSSNTVVLTEDKQIWITGLASFILAPTSNHLTPFNPSLPYPVLSIASSDANILFLLQDGSVWGIGTNREGQLGVGDNTKHIPKAVKMILPMPATAISIHLSHSLILLQDGSVYACGNNWHGQVGNTLTHYLTSVPVQVNLPQPAVKIIALGTSSLILLLDGSVWVFGLTIFNTVEGKPLKLELPQPVIDIAYNHDHYMMLLEDGTVLIYRKTEAGSLTTHILYLPLPVKFVCATDSKDCMVLEDGSLWLSSNDEEPTETPLSAKVVSLASGDHHTVMLLENGEVYGFGSNWAGQLGLGRKLNRLKPAMIITLSQRG